MKVVQADKRGFVEVFTFKKREYLLIYTRAGYTRGGHSHGSTQVNILLDGTIEWNNKQVLPVTVIDTPSNVFHIMKSITDSLVLEWKVKGDGD